MSGERKKGSSKTDLTKQKDKNSPDWLLLAGRPARKSPQNQGEGRGGRGLLSVILYIFLSV
jgi:hypothetical protein